MTESPRCGYCGGDHPPCYRPIRHTWLCKKGHVHGTAREARECNETGDRIDGDGGAQ